MSAAAAALALVQHAQAPALMRLLLLPSVCGHPQRLAQRWPAGLAQRIGSDPAWRDAAHRHLSRAWQPTGSRLDVEAAMADPMLAVAALPQEAFERVVLGSGMALLAPALRRVIARDEVARVRAELGEEGLAFARNTPVVAGFEPPPLALDGLSSRCRQWGESLLAHALLSASADVARGAGLRLSPEAAAGAGDLPQWGIRKPEQAAALVLAVLDRLEPQWRSSFPSGA